MANYILSTIMLLKTLRPLVMKALRSGFACNTPPSRSKILAKIAKLLFLETKQEIKPKLWHESKIYFPFFSFFFFFSEAPQSTG